MNIKGFFDPKIGSCRVNGEKAAQLLHGQFTNDIEGLKSGEGNYNLLLTQKGHVLADLYIFREGGDFILLVEEVFQETVATHLLKYAPLSKVQLEDETGEWTYLHLITPTKSVGTKAFPTNRLGITGWDLRLPIKEKEKTIADLIDQGFVSMDSTLVETIRVEQGIPKVGKDITSANLPQEGRLERALNFEKGCYLGQEIIARLHYKGHVNKILVGLQGKELITEGTRLIRDGKEVGQVTSSIYSPRLCATLSLGYVPFGTKIGEGFLVGPNHQEVAVVELPLTDSHRTKTGGRK